MKNTPDSSLLSHSSIDHLLRHIKENAVTERDQGAAFEKLMIWWFNRDPVNKAQFGKILSYKDWAKAQKKASEKDTGIDLVAEDADSGESIAIQCKFYDPEGAHRIQRKDIDSFITASGSPDFSRRIFIETTGKEWGKHAHDAINDQDKDTQKD